MRHSPLPRCRRGALALACASLVAGSAAFARSPGHAARDEPLPAPAKEPVGELARSLQLGDLVFTRIGAYPFRKVADATGSWTNHVGIVLDTSGPEPVIGESRFPFSGSTTLARFVALFSAGPARTFGLPGGTLAVGSPADVTLFDPEARVKVEPHRFLSKSRNTPFSGWELTGAPAATIVGGEIVWQRVEL